MPFVYRYNGESGLSHLSGPGLDILVNRLGAELIGMTWRHPRLGAIPLLWRNGHVEPPPKYWKSHAPILFPIVGGMHDLKSTTTDGRRIWFKKQHGFARHSTFDIVAVDTSADHAMLSYRLTDNEETRAMFPWRFSLTATYTLYADRLIQTLVVSNQDERPLPFQLGWHPGFNTPFRDGDKARCALRLPQGKLRMMHNDDRCYLTGTSEEIESSGSFPFTEPGLDRTYMFDLSHLPREARFVELLDPDQALGVRVSFDDYPHLGIWSDAQAPFICIEPWQGMDDSVVQEPFDRKFGMTLLPPGTSDTRHVLIELIGF